MARFAGAYATEQSICMVLQAMNRRLQTDTVVIYCEAKVAASAPCWRKSLTVQKHFCLAQAVPGGNLASIVEMRACGPLPASFLSVVIRRNPPKPVLSASASTETVDAAGADTMFRLRSPRGRVNPKSLFAVFSRHFKTCFSPDTPRMSSEPTNSGLVRTQ